MSDRVHERRAEEGAVEAVIEGTENGTGQVEALLSAASAAPDDESGAELAGTPARERLDGIVESLLFAAGTPLALRRLVDVLDGPPAREVKAAIERLMAEYNRPERGFHLLAVAGGFQFRSAPAYSDWVRTLLRERPARLGRAALETLAIIAYKQPATRAEIEAVRGVDADSALTSLLAKRLIKIAGRKEAVGRPLMYTTTPEFLEVFGLNDLNELPALKEIGPVQEPEDETLSDGGDEWRAAAEDPQSRGGELAADGGEHDPRRASDGERADGDGAGDPSPPAAGSDRD
jgi:segregation and condensation protein B